MLFLTSKNTYLFSYSSSILIIECISVLVVVCFVKVSLLIQSPCLCHVNFRPFTPILKSLPSFGEAIVPKHGSSRCVSSFVWLVQNRCPYVGQVLLTNQQRLLAITTCLISHLGKEIALIFELVIQLKIQWLGFPCQNI